MNGALCFLSMQCPEHVWDDLRQLSGDVRCCRVARMHDHGSWLGAEAHILPTMMICLRGTVRISCAPQQHIDIHNHEVVIIEAGCFHKHPAFRHQGISLHLGFTTNRLDIGVNYGEERYLAHVVAEPYRSLVDSLLLCEHMQQRCELMQRYVRTLVDDQQLEITGIHPAARNMYEYIRLHCHRSITVRHIIKASGLSQSRAFTIFSEAYGETPYQMLTKRRCALAQAFLRNGLSVQESAEKSGFVNRRHLTRAFNELYKCSPKAWLKLYG